MKLRATTYWTLGVMAGLVLAYCAAWASSSLGLLYVGVTQTERYESDAPTVAAAGIRVGAMAHGLHFGDRPLWYAPWVRLSAYEPEVGLLTVLLYDDSRRARRYRISSAEARDLSGARTIPLSLFPGRADGGCTPTPHTWGEFRRTSGYAPHVRPEPDWMGVARHGFGCGPAPRPELEQLGDAFEIVLQLEVEDDSGAHEETVEVRMVRRRSRSARIRTLIDTLASMG